LNRAGMERDRGEVVGFRGGDYVWIGSKLRWRESVILLAFDAVQKVDTPGSFNTARYTRCNRNSETRQALHSI
jgi:hypothetical protein